MSGVMLYSAATQLTRSTVLHMNWRKKKKKIVTKPKGTGKKKNQPPSDFKNSLANDSAENETLCDTRLPGYIQYPNKFAYLCRSLFYLYLAAINILTKGTC